MCECNIRHWDIIHSCETLLGKDYWCYSFVLEVAGLFWLLNGAKEWVVFCNIFFKLPSLLRYSCSMQCIRVWLKKKPNPLNYRLNLIWVLCVMKSYLNNILKEVLVLCIHSFIFLFYFCTHTTKIVPWSWSSKCIFLQPTTLNPFATYWISYPYWGYHNDMAPTLKLYKVTKKNFFSCKTSQ